MIGRIVMHAGALVAGIVIGAALVLAAGSAPGVTPDPAPSPSSPASPTSPGSPAPTADDPSPTATTPTTTPVPGSTSPGDDAPMPATAGALLLAWTVGGLPDGFASGVAGIGGVREVTEVVAGRLDLTESRDRTGAVVDQPDPGWAVPLDATAIDPATFKPFVPTVERPVLEQLESGTSVILGETSAELRGIGVGGQLMIGGESRTVVGVLDDATVGAAEVVFHRDDPLADGMTPRYVLLRHDAERSDVERALRGLAADRPIRVRAPGETPYLRHGDAVLPQAIVKRRYGEFHYRPPAAGARVFDVEQGWIDEHIVTREVAILGAVTCHRAAVDSLDAVLTEVDRRGLAHAVDPEGYEGCWYPRLISVGGDLSRHSWGIAVDVNAEGNPTGTGSGQHPALVELFTEAGWGWGGTWLVPDPMHFELVDQASLPIKVRP